MSFTYRSATPEDFPRLIELFQAFAIFENHPEGMTNTVERMQAEQDLFNAFVVENNQQIIVGFASYFYSYHTWSGKSTYMDDLYVQEAYRQQGVGQALLNMVIEQAKKEKCVSVRWLVSDWNNNAQDFYKKMGATISQGEYNCKLSL